MAQHTFSRSHTDWSRVGKRTMIGLLIVVLAAVGFLLFSFKINHFSVSMRLNGEANVQMEYGESFVEPGAELILQGTHMLKRGISLDSSRVSRSGELDEKTIGRYDLTYSGSIFGMSAQCHRTVTIVDTVSPVITLTKDVSKRWQIGYTVIDNYDGDISDWVKAEENLGRMSFSVTDSSGNPAYIEKSIPFYDREPPQIQLTGGEEYVIPAGFRYVEPGYTALDNADGILTDQVQVAGEVNWFVPGIYPVTYTVMDSMENEGMSVRSVQVVAKERPIVQMPEDKTVYLTFDDGPGPYTTKLLDVLDRYQVKATFFVKDSENVALIKEIADRGHSIGIHSVTHNYEQVYASPEAYFEDLRGMQDIIYQQTGVVTTLMRFPGGSSNTVSKGTYPGLMSLLSEAVQDAGYQYFDWNVDSNDAGGARNTQTVADNVIRGISENPVSVVLQHDIHDYSVDAVEQILQWGMENGYSFKALSPDSPGYHHPIAN